MDLSEDSLWRKRKSCASDEALDTSAHKLPKLMSAAPIYITLAKESPRRQSWDERSDDSVYGSFHERETDFCRDTSDTDSYSTDGIATMEVVEYEVASTSATEDLYSNDSSSGTDDFVVAAAELARAIFVRSPGANSSTDDNFEMFADTEESDGPTDPELGRADYWTCVKCKNRQNNPMYRYCEKCYQIRKTHFPPRPKLRKTRSSSTKLRSSATSRGVIMKFSGTSSDSINNASGDEADKDNQLHKRRRRRRLRRRSRKELSSSRQQQTKSAYTDSINSLGENCFGGNIFNINNLNNLMKTNRAAVSAAELKLTNRTGDSSPVSDENDSSERPKTKCYNTHSSSNDCATSSTSKADLLVDHNFKIHNKFFKNVVSTKVQPPTHLNIIPHPQHKDSGFSSCCSSMELSPDVPPSQSSQETYCSDIEDGPSKHATTVGVRDLSGDDLIISGAETIVTTVSLTSQCSTVSQASTSSSLTTTDIRSISSCSERLPDSYDINLDEATALCPSLTRRPNSDVETNAGKNHSEYDVMASPCKKSKTLDFIVDNSKMSDTSSLAGGNGVVNENACMMCLTQPKNGVFVHSRFLHMCCCYRCAVKVWNKRKRCPICNCKVKNVMKLFVH